MNAQFLVIIGIAGMLALSVGLIYFVIMHQRKVLQHHIESLKAQQEYEQQLQVVSHEAQEQTMSQLASELHDDIGVTLSSVKLFLSKSSDARPELMIQSRLLLDESIEKLRMLSHRLHPATLQHLGLSTAIQTMLDVIHQTGLVQTEFVCSGDTVKLPEDIELPVYRVVQELLNNLIKHAALTHIRVHISVQDNLLTIIINHNGQGINNEEHQAALFKKGAIGLKGIYNRIQRLKATLNFEQLPGQHFQISILTPLNTAR